MIFNMVGQEFRQSSGDRPGFFYGYVIVAVAFIIMVLSWGTFFSFGIFFKPLVAEFGWTRAMTSGAFTLASFVRGILSIVTGKLSDRFGLRIVMITCCLLLGLGFLLMSRISSVWQLYLFYGVMVATGMAGCWVPLIATVARWFVRRRGLMTGIVTSGIGMGTAVIPPIATRLISAYDWRTSYLILGIAVMVIVIIAAQFLKRDPYQIGNLPYGEDEKKQAISAPVVKGYSLQEARHTRQFWMSCIIYFCFGFFVHTITVHIVPHITELGFSPISAANILAVTGVTNLIGRIVMGGASDRIGIRLSLCFAFVLASVVFLWLQISQELWMFYLFAVIFGISYGGLSAMQSLVIAELFGLSSLGVIVGSLTFSFTIGNALGVFLAGYIFDVTGSYYLAFWLCAALAIAGLALTIFLKPLKGGYSHPGYHSR